MKGTDPGGYQPINPDTGCKKEVQGNLLTEMF